MGDRYVAPALPHRPYPLVHNGGTPARWCSDHIEVATPPLEPVRPLLSLISSVHVEPDTTAGFGCGPVTATAAYRSTKSKVIEVYDHA